MVFLVQDNEAVLLKKNVSILKAYPQGSDQSRLSLYRATEETEVQH